MTDSLINLEQVARMLGGISVKSVRRLIASQKLPKPIKVLSVPTLPLSDIQAFIEREKSNRGGKPV